MAKYAPDAMLDASLNYVAGSNIMTVCSGSPTTYADAYTNNKLAGVDMSSGSFVKADDISGRKLTMTSASAVPVTVSGTAMAVALLNTIDMSLRYVTTCVPQDLVAGGSVDIPSWKINLGDPT